MTVKNVLMLNALVALVFGVALAVVPEQLLSIYEVTTDSAGLLLAQLFGAAALGYAFLTWFARDSAGPGSEGGLVLALTIGWGVGFIVALLGQLSGVMNTLGWSIPALYLLFALAYGYLGFIRPSAS
ncbi:MAG: hypothetical protein ACE5NC_04890 [Anaerolineae bacterium]